jgi:two-component system KDP operon response regulator KdpE
MNAPALKVLVVDDEPPIRKLLRMGLTAEGYQVIDAPNGKTALAELPQKPDVVILDLGLPDVQGLELLRALREKNEGIPIVVLSSRADEAAKIQALDLGADDYVTKPFSMNELLARIRAAVRHQLQSQGERPIFQVGDLSVDLVRRIVKMRGQDVKLSPKEYDLLRIFSCSMPARSSPIIICSTSSGGRAPTRNMSVSTFASCATRSSRNRIAPNTFTLKPEWDTACACRTEARAGRISKGSSNTDAA